MTEHKVFEALLDPRWSVGSTEFDRRTFPKIQLLHPRHGQIEWLLLTLDSARSLAATLSKVADEIETSRMK